MMKKPFTANSTASLVHHNSEIQQKSSAYTPCNDRSQVHRLQTLLQKETQQRKDSYQELLNLYNHLQQTKKTKIPVKFDKVTTRKFFSPNKHFLGTRQISSPLNNNSEVSFPPPSHSQQKIMSRVEQVLTEMRQIQSQIGYLKNNIEQQLQPVFSQIESLQRKNIQLETTISEDINRKCRSMIENNRKELTKLVCDKIERESEALLKCSQDIRINMQIIQQSVEGFEKNINRDLKSAYETIIETKQSIEESFGIKDRKINSSVSIQLTQQSGRKTTCSPLEEKVNWSQKRIESIERRMDVIYQQYLARPIK